MKVEKEKKKTMLENVYIREARNVFWSNCGNFECSKSGVNVLAQNYSSISEKASQVSISLIIDA